MAVKTHARPSGSLRIRGRFRIRIKKFARILDMQRVTDAHGDIETHPTDITLSGLERRYTLLTQPCFVSQLLLRHAAIQSEFPHAHVSILP